MGVIRVKPGVQFTTIAPGGFRLLAALDYVAEMLDQDLTITSACDGTHSGPRDPHKRGCAYDVRTRNLVEEVKLRVVNQLQNVLGPEFYVFLESPNTPNEHIHMQVTKGTTFPAVKA